MERIKDVFRYIEEEYPKKLEEVKVNKGIQRRLIDETIEEKLDKQLNTFLKFENINIKLKLGPSYNRSLAPWIQLYTEDNRKGTKGHYGGISFENKGEISLWLGFGQTALKKDEIIEKRNQFLREYAKIEINLKHGFQYEQVFVEAVIISKTYRLEDFAEEKFYRDIEYLMNLYKKHEANKKFGILEQDNNTNLEEKEEIKEEYSSGHLEKGISKLYKGYSENGKRKRILEEYLYKKDDNRNNILDEKGCPIIISSAQYERVIFHPEYKRGEFLYQVEPVSNQYMAGSFLRILKKAIKYPEMNFYLIIEDFNQENIFGIFGDTINLLERDENGRSKYEIHNQVISTYIYGIEGKGNAIYIPENLIILGIENPKGKKVNQLIEDKFEIEWVETTNEKLDNYYVKGLNNMKWGRLRKAINDQIEEKINKIDVEEDKIDSYFLKEEMLTDEVNTEEMQGAREKLAQKLFVYLYEKVCQYDKTIIFNAKIRTVEELLQKVKSTRYLEIFNDEIQEKIKG